MLIKYNGLIKALENPLKPIYILFGEDAFLLADAALCIKKKWYGQEASDYQQFTPQSSADWSAILDEANSYTLFTQNQIIEIHSAKKSFDKTIEKLLLAYSQSPNPQTLLILNAPLSGLKEIQKFLQHPSIDGVHITPLTAQQQKDWISQALLKEGIKPLPYIIQDIFNLTAGNMLSCAQSIQRLALFVGNQETPPSSEAVQAQLINQIEHENHTLIEACLKGDLKGAIPILQQAIEDRDEALLVLWYITKLLRELNALYVLTHQGLSFQDAAQQVGIWRNRLGLYQLALKRLNKNIINKLFNACQKFDMQLKTSTVNATLAMTRIVSILCTGHEVLYEI